MRPNRRLLAPLAPLANLALFALLAAPLAGCGEAPTSNANEGLGSIEVALTAAPDDAHCLEIMVTGARTVTRRFELAETEGPSFSVGGLPIGVSQVSAAAFGESCGTAAAGGEPLWLTETPVDVVILPRKVARALLHLVRNGRLQVAVAFEEAPWITGARAPFDVAVIGDTPYGAAQVLDFPNLVAHINGDPAVSLVLHLGDIKNGSSRCDTEYFQTINGYFSLFQDPLVYTPGDNEWTDCHRANNGAFDPLERLDTLRRIFYPVPGLALGAGRKQVKSQSFDPGQETFVENQLWMHGGVAFGAIHAVGSNNNLAPWFRDDTTGAKMDDPARREAEATARIAAGVAWLEQVFALAADRDAAGVVILMQADTFSGSDSSPRRGFEATMVRLADLSRAFAKPVLLLQGDSHVYRTDVPFATGSVRYGVTQPVPNLTRVVVQGSTSGEWLKLHVDPTGPQPFAWTRIQL